MSNPTISTNKPAKPEDVYEWLQACGRAQPMGSTVQVTRTLFDVASAQVLFMRDGLAAKDAEIERLRKLVSDVASVAEGSLDPKFDGCESHRKTVLSVIADDCRKHLAALSAGGSE